MFLTSPLIDQAIAQACTVCSPLPRLGEYNGDLRQLPQFRCLARRMARLMTESRLLKPPEPPGRREDTVSITDQ
jgi:hypothetical protein